MIEGGKVHYNGQRAKTSKIVEIGAIIRLRQGNEEKEVAVVAINAMACQKHRNFIVKPTISEYLEDYFARSEQLQTHLFIRVGEFDGKAVAGGTLLQIMPDGTGTPEDFEHLSTLASTIKEDEFFGLLAEELLHRLFHEETVEVYPSQATEFKCGCSHERSGTAIMLLPDLEVDAMLAEKDGAIDIQCECCGTQYFFDETAIEELRKART